MSEDKKIIRMFIIVVVWVVFTAVTLSGLVTAAERTEFISTGKEAVTVMK